MHHRTTPTRTKQPISVVPPTPANLQNWNDATLWVKTNNSPFYGATYMAANCTVTQTASAPQLTITLNNTAADGLKYSTGQVVSKATYGYGLFRCSMQTAKQVGLNNAFFTYVDPSGKGVNDEIDIEILGSDTSTMLCTYYSQGIERKSTPVALGFDSSLAMHVYAINWTPASIEWIVDGKVVLTEAASAAAPLPTIPTQIYAQLWTAGSPGTWFGDFVYTQPVHAVFQAASFKPYVAT